MELRNELGVIVLFAQFCEAVGFEIISIQVAYPDAVVIKDGITYKAEFEFKASSFKKHEHDPRGCDLVICWVNDWPDCPLPVLALSETDWSETDLTLPSRATLVDAFHQQQVLQMQRENRPKKEKKKARGKRPIKAETGKEFWHRIQRPAQDETDVNGGEMEEVTAQDEAEEPMKERASKSYQGYAVCVTDEQARAAFVKKYGRPAKELHRSKGSVLAGPLTVQEVDHE